MTPRPSPSLRDVQRWMKSRIVSAHGAAVGGEVALSAQRGTPGVERLRVYADAYQTRIFEALSEAYPAIRHILGAAACFELAAAYAAAHPSQDYNLSLTGRALPEFLRTAPVTQRLPFLPDLAQLEWRVVEAFHAFDRPPVAPARVAGLAPDAFERARIAFQPSLALVRSAWPVCDLWAARTQPRETVNVELRDRPQAVLVFRQGTDVTCVVIEPDEAEFIAQLRAGRTLGEACAALAERPGADPSRVTAWCQGWMRRGLLVEVS